MDDDETTGTDDTEATTEAVEAPTEPVEAGPSVDVLLAKIQTLEAALMDAESANIALKAMNYDLLMAVPGESNSGEDEAAITAVDEATVPLDELLYDNESETD